MYYHQNEHHSLWVHLENVDEAAPFNSRYDPLSHGVMAHFNEYHDPRPMKRVTSIDVIENENVDENDTKEAQSEIKGQLLRFGYSEKEIAAALKAVDNPLDINDVVGWIESEDHGQSVNLQQVMVHEDGLYFYFVRNGSGNERNFEIFRKC